MSTCNKNATCKLTEYFGPDLPVFMPGGEGGVVLLFWLFSSRTSGILQLVVNHANDDIAEVKSFFFKLLHISFS